MDERQSLLALHLTGVVGPRRLVSLKGAFARLEAAFGSTEDRLAYLPNWTTSVARKVLSLKDPEASAQRELERAGELGIRCLVEGDADFPGVFRDLFDPPFVLWMKGHYLPEDERALAVIGCRQPTAYGKDLAARLAQDLARCGYTVVSGLARGIDSCAHQGALRHPQGRTLAFLGSGLLNLYPPENRKLADRVVERGALFSEYPLDAKPLALHFPQRNRLISGAAKGVLVVEANQNSGSFITVDHAVDQGKPVFAVPGPIHHHQSEGTHSLIQQGARLVVGVQDIFDELNDKRAERHWRAEPRPAPEAVEVTEEEKMLLAHLDSDPRHVDALSRLAGLPSRRLNEILLVLEMKGLVEQAPGHCFLKL
ncbi:MAG TPA: DNA-processing protein DprA [bacterium]|nr:DNA-processing protein DprA [bacterium]